jgi:hypothetical protein
MNASVINELEKLGEETSGMKIVIEFSMGSSRSIVVNAEGGKARLSLRKIDQRRMD